MQDSLKAITERILEYLGAEVSELTVSTNPVGVCVSSPDSKLLIGPHGEHLRALNHLIKKLLEKETGEDVRGAHLIDINGYAQQQRETLRANARMLAQRARLFKHDVEMSPMSPYERMVIHELFAEDPEIRTESRGEGKFRHVVLKYGEKEGTRTENEPL